MSNNSEDSKFNHIINSEETRKCDNLQLSKSFETESNEIVKYVNDEKEKNDHPFLAMETQGYVSEIDIQDFIDRDLEAVYSDTLGSDVIRHLLAIQKELKATNKEKRMEKKIRKKISDNQRQKLPFLTLCNRNWNNEINDLNIFVSDGKVTIACGTQRRTNIDNSTVRKLLMVFILFCICFLVLAIIAGYSVGIKVEKGRQENEIEKLSGFQLISKGTGLLYDAAKGLVTGIFYSSE